MCVKRFAGKPGNNRERNLVAALRMNEVTERPPLTIAGDIVEQDVSETLAVAWRQTGEVR